MTEDRPPYNAGAGDLTDPEAHEHMAGCRCQCETPSVNICCPDFGEDAKVVFQCRYGELVIEMRPGGDQEVTITYRDRDGGSLHLDRINDHQARVALSPPSKQGGTNAPAPAQ